MRGDAFVPLSGADRQRFEAALDDATVPGYVTVRAVIALGVEGSERLARATAMGREFVAGVRRRVAEGRGAALLVDRPSTVERVLDAATQQLVAAGRAELAIGEVAAAVRIPRRTLYRSYDAGELIEACQRRATTLWRARFMRRIQRADASDVERLFLVVDAIADWVGTARFQGDQLLFPPLAAGARGDEFREHVSALVHFGTELARRAQVAEAAAFGIFVATSVIGAAAWAERRDEARAAAISIVERLVGASRRG